MARWRHRVKVRHLFTDAEDHASIQQSMSAIADALQAASCFHGFNLSRFRQIPEGDEVVGAVDYANKLLDRMYDFADTKLIWIE